MKFSGALSAIYLLGAVFAHPAHHRANSTRPAHSQNGRHGPVTVVHVETSDVVYVHETDETFVAAAGQINKRQLPVAGADPVAVPTTGPPIIPGNELTKPATTTTAGSWYSRPWKTTSGKMIPAGSQRHHNGTLAHTHKPVFERKKKPKMPKMPKLGKGDSATDGSDGYPNVPGGK